MESAEVAAAASVAAALDTIEAVREIAIDGTAEIEAAIATVNALRFSSVHPIVLYPNQDPFVTDRLLEITAIVWKGGAGVVPNDEVVLTDQFGAVKWQAHATGAHYSDRVKFYHPIFSSGLRAANIENGRVFVYWR